MLLLAVVLAQSLSMFVVDDWPLDFNSASASEAKVLSKAWSSSESDGGSNDPIHFIDGLIIVVS